MGARRCRTSLARGCVRWSSTGQWAGVVQMARGLEIHGVLDNLFAHMVEVTFPPAVAPLISGVLRSFTRSIDPMPSSLNRSYGSQ